MTRKLLVLAFILFCLNKINGQKIYEKDPGLLGSLGGDQVPSNGQENSNDRVNVFTYHLCLLSDLKFIILTSQISLIIIFSTLMYHQFLWTTIDYHFGMQKIKAQMIL